MYEIDPTAHDGQFNDAPAYDEMQHDAPAAPDNDSWEAVEPEEPEQEGQEIDDNQPEAAALSLEGKYDSAGFPRTDLYDRVRNLGLPEDSLVVVGSGALEAIVGPDVRRAADIDLAVTPEVYGYLRNQGEMEEVVMPDGARRLVGNGLDVGTEWYGKPVEELRAHGYTHQGVNVAGLPEVYAYKQQRGEAKDLHDLQLIRDRAYGDKPLPLGVIKGELEFVKGCMPEHLHGRPELQVAANGLYVVRTVFGNEDSVVKGYSGEVEQGHVPATYHAWEHSAYGARDGQRNIEAVEARRQEQGLPPAYTDDDRVAAVAGYANHDVILGHGRRAANPERHDELQSANLVAKHLEAVGADDIVVEKAHASVMATTFNEAKKAQDISPERGHIQAQELSAGSDLSGFRRQDAPLGAVRLSVEDLSRTGAGYDKPLQRLIEDLNRELPKGTPPLQIRTVEDGLRLVDQYPDYPVTKAAPNPSDPPQQMTLREALATHLTGSSKFMAGYQFPSSWELGSPAQQARSAAFLDELAAQVRNGELTAQEALRKAQEYTLRPEA